MKERLEHLEKTVEELARQVAAISRALGPIPDLPDESVPDSTAPAGAGQAAAPAPSQIGHNLEAWIERNRLVLLAGLVCLVLAGGMVLRIIAVSALVPLGAGAGAGLAYCAFLVLIAERQYSRGRTFHGDVFAVLAVLILDALLVEVTYRPDGFSNTVACIVLAASVVVLSVLGVMRGRSIPFALALLAAPVAGVLVGGNPFLHPYYAGILALTILAGQAGARWRSWGWARVGPAVIVVLYILVLWFISQAAARRDMPQHAFALPLPALVIFGGFFAICVLPAAGASLLRSRQLDLFEIGLAIVVAVTTFAGATGVLLSFSSGRILAGAVGLALSALFYVTAASSYRRHGSESGGFYAMNALAFLYALAGLAFLLDSSATLGVAYEVFAAALALIAGRLVKRTLAFQADAVSLMAFLVLLIGVVDLTPPGREMEGRLADALWLLIAGALAIGTFALLRSFHKPGEEGGIASSGTRRAAALMVLATGGFLVIAGSLPYAYDIGQRMLGPAVAAGSSAALWETLMTVLLVLGAVAALAAGIRLHEDGTIPIAAALMAIAGVKLFLFDAMGLAATYLICSSAVFGVGLILCSFLYRRHRGLSSAGRPSATEETDDP